MPRSWLARPQTIAIRLLSSSAVMGRLFVFQGSGFYRTLCHFVRLLIGRHLGDAALFHTQVRSLDVDADLPRDVQVDGEPTGTTPVHISVVPKALRVLVPCHLPPGPLSES